MICRSIAMCVGVLILFLSPACGQDGKSDKAALKIEGKWRGKQPTRIKEIWGRTDCIVDATTISLIGFEDKKVKLLMSYKVDASTTPATVDLVVLEGPASFGVEKETPAYGIVDAYAGGWRLAFTFDKSDRPKNFEDKKAYKITFTALR